MNANNEISNLVRIVDIVYNSTVTHILALAVLALVWSHGCVDYKREQGTTVQYGDIVVSGADAALVKDIAKTLIATQPENN